MARLKPNIINVSGEKLSDEEFAKIERQFAETGHTGETPWNGFIEAFKQNPDKIISYEDESLPFDEFCKRLQNGEYDE